MPCVDLAKGDKKPAFPGEVFVFRITALNSAVSRSSFAVSEAEFPESALSASGGTCAWSWVDRNGGPGTNDGFDDAIEPLFSGE